jgi:archaellum component FlaC
MDAEIKNEFGLVRADLRNTDGRVQSLDARVERLDSRVQTLDSRVQTLDASLHEVDARLSADIRRVETTLRQEIREEGIATRRHFDVVAESLRDDIRIIAEGLIALDAKVETIRDSG